jgi:transposase-like protein
MKSLRCPNRECPLAGVGNIIRHGFYQTSSGKRRRYLCWSCGKTFCANIGTPYYRLQDRRATFDEVAALSVEGLNKSAIARVKQIAWNTVARWLEKAAHSCRRFEGQSLETGPLSMQIRNLTDTLGFGRDGPIHAAHWWVWYSRRHRCRLYRWQQHCRGLYQTTIAA